MLGDTKAIKPQNRWPTEVRSRKKSSPGQSHSNRLCNVYLLSTDGTALKTFSKATHFTASPFNSKAVLADLLLSKDQTLS